jgi:hypothetical protein
MCWQLDSNTTSLQRLLTGWLAANYATAACFTRLLTSAAAHALQCAASVSQVRTRTDLPQYNRPTSEVIRRFRDFAHLENMLSEKNK